MMPVWLDELFYVFITLVAIVNPIQAAAAFVTLTEGRSDEDQAVIARRAAIVAGVALMVFAFIGEALLKALGVELGAFKIAGGLLLLRVSFNMVFAQDTAGQTADRAKTSPLPASDPSVFPLAIPIITGPGALTTSVALVYPTRAHPELNAGIFAVCAVTVIVITYFFMRGAEGLTKFFGQTGVDAVGRIVGILVAAIAVQLMINGITSLTSFTLH
jgi:multiple antibiotic resistance protein